MQSAAVRQSTLTKDISGVGIGLCVRGRVRVVAWQFAPRQYLSYDFSLR